MHTVQLWEAMRLLDTRTALCLTVYIIHKAHFTVRNRFFFQLELTGAVRESHLLLGFFVEVFRRHKDRKKWKAGVPIEGGEGRAGASQPSASSWCVAPPQQRATFTMALAASRTLLALFVTFCAPRCGWTGKEKKRKKICLLFPEQVHVIQSDNYWALLLSLESTSMAVVAAWKFEQYFVL